MHTKLNRLSFLPRFFALSVALLLAGPSRSADRPLLLPLESFFAEPDIRSVKLSPDGKYLAFLTTLGTGKVGIALMDLSTGKTEPLVSAKDENIKRYFWKGGDYIVYSGDLGGNESSSLRSISIAKRKVVALAESYRERYSDLANQAVIVDTLKFDPYNLLIFGNKEVGGSSFQYWKLDIRTGERRASSYQPVPDTQDLAVDNTGLIRARCYLVGDKAIIEVRPDPTSESSFVKVREFPAKSIQWQFVGFAADNETLYLINHEQSATGSLQGYNVRTRQLGPVLFSASEVEIDGQFSPFAGYENACGVLFSYDRSKLYGVTYSPDRTLYKFFDPARARLQAQIDASLPNALNLIISTSADEKRLVILSTSDRDPGTFYLLDLQVPRIMPIGKNNRLLNPAQLQPMEPIQFAARDGMLIRGYLTRPPGSENKRAPLVVNPHGGPFGPRDFWHYDGEVQFLANRGYAVLQINYRGSGGYGTAFEHAGYKEWGGKMQDDLTDGVKWAIAQGITDDQHVGIYGASYGGYAALAGVTFTPELYRCAVNYVGVSDLGIIAGKGNAARANRGYEMHATDRVGDDPAYIHDRSPVNFVERIRVPTLHAYGFNDPRVDIKHWTRLEAELKKYGKDYEILIEGNEGHGFANDGSRMEFYKRLENFLAKNMGVNDPSVRLAPLQVLEMPAKDKSG